ncbi:AAA family ATPase [Cytobacillus oceanisediminis]|uniref:AAA family ATPase n=1 Tax=Cytobacillus oceanisediminis TaxID=665099 RepID=UPI00207A6F08|nr:AAA family ATPase [Cytobacillus oceanisediminis]USK46316.1 AAA family ATPase [Cytobacillus oceanisediminis]
MKINFKTLTIQNFKSHRDLTVNFGERTEITGDNTKGKSSIPEAITFLLYGTDTLGSKTDPTPITYDSDETIVSLLFTVDEKKVLLGRALKKGKAQYYINEVPSKAKEFNEIVEQLFDKELFFSLFNPNYFFTLHWEKQRAMLLQYVTSPVNKEVLKQLPEMQGNRLEELLKKHSLGDIEEINKEIKKKKAKAYIAAQSRTKTLQEQLEQLTDPKEDIDSLKAELAAIDIEVRELESELDKAWEKNQAYNNLQSQIKYIQDRIEMSKERWPALKNEVIEDTCKTCKQPLDATSVEAVNADKEHRIAEYKSIHNGLLKERDELKKQLAETDFIDRTELQEKVKEADAKGQPIRESIRIHSQYEGLKTQVRNAEADEKSTLQALNDAIFVLDSIKAFRAKEAELQGEKVQALFETLSIKLFEDLKNGEIKASFEIEMDGKGYRKLSLSEGIRAGLELREVLSNQSEVIAPVFIDNAESITSFKQPTGQLITSRVVAGQELKIEAVKS